MLSILSDGRAEFVDEQREQCERGQRKNHLNAVLLTVQERNALDTFFMEYLKVVSEKCNSSKVPENCFQDFTGLADARAVLWCQLLNMVTRYCNDVFL